MHTDIHDIVNDYSERGWALVPNALCTKKPIISKWQTICADPDAAKTLFAAHKNSNIGIVLGAASGGIVDVDLDGPNAAVVAQHLLPYTRLRFGRASKPNSHWLYRVPNPGSIKQFEHPETGAMLVELRGNGHQTILPPSIHKSGEAVSFTEGGEDSEPATSDWNTLERCCALLATALVFLDYWQRGQRHRSALSLAGLLAQCGVTEMEAQDIMAAIVKVTGDDEALDRITCVRTTYQRAYNHQPVSTFRL